MKIALILLFANLFVFAKLYESMTNENISDIFKTKLIKYLFKQIKNIMKTLTNYLKFKI